MMIRDLFCYNFLFIASIGSIAEVSKLPSPPNRTQFASQRITIPLIEATPRPVIEAFITDHGPYKFVLDTGAPGTFTFADKFRQQFKLTPINHYTAAVKLSIHVYRSDVMGNQGILVHKCLVS